MGVPQQQKADKYLGYFLIFLLLPPTRLLGLLMRRNHSLKPEPENILFIKILGLGSLITALDSIEVIKKNYPHARLILLTDKNIAAGIEPFGVFHEIWAFRSGNMISVMRYGLWYLLKAWQLKSCWVVDLEVYSKLTTVYSLLTAALNRFGFYLAPVFFRKNLNTHNVPFEQSAFLESNYHKMAEAVMGKNCETAIAISKPTGEEKPYIALNNTCSDLALVRKLPEQTFIAVCAWMLENTDYQIALTGAPEDRAGIQNLIENTPALTTMQNRILNIAGSMDFPAYYDFLKHKCALMISIDSAPLHIAKKLGLATLSIWGPTNPDNYFKIPQEEKTRHLVCYQRVSCSPCVHHFEKLPCNGDNFCMKNISAAQITTQLQLLLRELSPVN